MKHIFLIRHADQLRVSNNFENSQVANEKIILSAKGEKQAQKISQLKELKNIDEIFSSSYSRAISTAKYIAEENNIDIIIDKNLNENLKNIGGESRKEVTKRMEQFLNKILNDDNNKKIVAVSHGASIKFLLMQWCTLNENNNLEYQNKQIIINSPSVIELTFKGKELTNLKQIV